LQIADAREVVVVVPGGSVVVPSLGVLVVALGLAPRCGAMVQSTGRNKTLPTGLSTTVTRCPAGTDKGGPAVGLCPVAEPPRITTTTTTTTRTTETIKDRSSNL
jgi:hypothetical protein